MLTGLMLRNFAIIEQLDVHIASGMTVLTGETGAGKSILVDALGLLLGDRAEISVIRHGAERSEIAAEFDLVALPAARRWLESRDLVEDAECLLRRSLGRDGRSHNYINGHSVPLAQLRELGEQLVDIHGQNEHQSLLHAGAQLGLLDGYAGTLDQVAVVAGLYAGTRAAEERLAGLQRASVDRDARLALLRHQVSELEALSLKAGELDSLEAEHRRLANASRLLEGARGALDSVYESDSISAYQLAHQALQTLITLSELDAALKPVYEALLSAEVQLQDAGDSLRRYLAGADLDPDRLAALEARLGAIHDLARKHRVEPQALPERFATLRMELTQLENHAVALQELVAETAHLHERYRCAALDLHAQRLQAATTLGTKVTGILHELGMPAARFAGALDFDAARFSPNGSDTATLEVSVNPGEPLKPVAQVASGGELSRIALAIEVAAARASAIPTLVFDEVDAGIGGGVAEIVGRYLRELGARRQVLCVTHLPQVASQARHHLRVAKQTDARRAFTRIESLEGEDRVEELARMLGGLKITATTREHAREMMQRAQRA
ncbi:MAG: DNA repair protein RecN [Gammaproteobacteria bacterium]